VLGCLLQPDEFSFRPEDSSPCLMVVDQPGSERHANLLRLVTFDPAFASGSPSVALPVISSPLLCAPRFLR
jgi:hypothetical protein